MKQCFTAAGLAALLAVAAACSNGAGAPTSPTPGLGGTGEAAADGSTLKATPPALQSPTGGGRIDTTEPTFVFGRSEGKFVAAQFNYRVEVTTTGGDVVYTSFVIEGGSDQIRHEIPFDLQLDTVYRWRARAENGGIFGPWSDYAEFRTIDYRGLNPRPPDGRWPSNGPDVVNYVAAAFPDYLEATGDLGLRIEHMEFLRDRIIEAGICGGMDLALNLKRGVGPHSHDAIAWNDNGRVRVIDIASAFDDPDIFLRLHWQEVAGPEGYDPYPDHPGC